MSLRFIALAPVLTVTGLGVGPVGDPQPGERMYRVGYLGLDSPGFAVSPLLGLQEELRATIPIETPAKFSLVINLKAANDIGLTMPPSLLRRASQVIYDKGLDAR